MGIMATISKGLGHIVGAVKILLSERSAAASLIALVALALFGVIGPLIYNVNPDTVFYRYEASIYVVDGGKAREIYGIDNIVATAAASTSWGFILYASSLDSDGGVGSLYIIDLSRDNGKPRIDTYRLGYNVSSLEATEDMFVIGTRDSIYIAGYRDGVLSTPREILRAPGKIEGLALTSRGIAWWGSSGKVGLIGLGSNDSYEGSIALAQLGWIPRAAVECGSRLFLVGDGGRISIIDLVDMDVKIYQPVFEDLLSAACSNGKAVVAGRYGSLVIIGGGVPTPINTGVVDNLIQIISTGDQLIAIGSGGTVVTIDPGSNTWSVREIRGVSGVKKASMVNGSLYLLSYGAFVAGLEPPSPRHPFGTNYYGKDLMAQVMIGVRMSLFIGIAVAAVVATIGTIVGMLSGYFRGRVDAVFNTTINFVYTIPLEPFAILLAMLMRPSMLTVIIAISALIWRTTARIIRSQTISVASSQMIEAARALGAGHARIIARYILPAVLPLVLLDFASVVAYSILAEATLGFLGVSAQDTYTLGSILNQARLTGAWRGAWWWIAIPGIFIGSISLSIYMMVRSLEPIANPRIKRALQPF